ncbi:MAG: CoA transferase [Actinomycetota bacterium]|nr:CoA transferase [Actinomycetota bacterium]
MAVTVGGAELSAQTCRRRLRPLLARVGDTPPVECTISWFGPSNIASESLGSEAIVQALSGLMEVHGWDAGHPRRIGLEMASVAAGALAANGVLGALIGWRRGQPVATVETSVLQAGLLLIAHHVAAATAEGDPLPSPWGPEPGPPFCTSDQRWFEIEVFDAEAWKTFWRGLGAGDIPLGRAWTSFRSRYYRGLCSLPAGLHELTSRHTLAQVSDVAERCGVSLSPVRSYREVLEDPGWRSSGWRLGMLAEPRPDLATSRPPHPAAGPLRPLDGIRVVEATSRMQGPLAGLLLQMLGADVVRVEPPGGDIGRMVPPSCGEVGSFFQCYNRGKQSVELDLGRPSGRSDLLDILGESDAFLHNWRPGKAAEWGLDEPNVLAGRGRRLVYAAATGWGEQAERGLIGTDFLVQAYAGFGDGLNPVGEPPRTSRVLLTDCMGALVTCEAILAALYLGETTGRSVSVGPSLLEGAMASQAHVLDRLAAGGGEDRRLLGRPVWGRLDRPIPTQDEYLVVEVTDEPAFRRLGEMCDVDGTPGSHPGIDLLLAERLESGSARLWEKQLLAADVPAAVVTRDLAAIPADARFSPLFESIGGDCMAPSDPWVLAQ